MRTRYIHYLSIRANFNRYFSKLPSFVYYWQVQRIVSMSSALKRKKGGSHKAKTAREWQQRLRLFAAGEKFGRGEKPSMGSEWNRVVDRIQSCPTHADRRMACLCRYHDDQSVSLTV